jgi:hypothetical protein
MKKVMHKITTAAIGSLMLAFAIGFAGCNKDDDGGNTNIDEMFDDGVYLTGTAAPTASAEQLFSSANNEAESNAAREGMYELYAILKAGDFKLYIVSAGKKGAEMGGTLKYTYHGSGVDEQVTSKADYYATSEGGAAIPVSTAGLYQIVYDTQLGTVVVIKVDAWGLRGDLNGWGFTPLTTSADYTEFSVTGQNIKAAGNFKFTHSGGWKLGVSDTLGTAVVKVNTNFGGAKNKLVAGGGDIAQFSDGDAAGAYDITLKFTPGKGYTVSKFIRTGELVLTPGGQATFRVTVPEMAGHDNQIAVAGNFADDDNPWTGTGHEMTKVSEGVYTLTTTVPDGFEYKYVISNYAGNGWIWESSSNREMPESLNVEDEVTEWDGDPFTAPPATEEGTFEITVNNHPGDGWTIYFTGNFDEKSWGDSDRDMTLKAGTSNVYTWTGQYPITGFEFKLIAKKDGEGDKWSSGDNVLFVASTFAYTISF